jgi:ubiquinone/menaquinone biosynthesis C-methylase UbiE
MPEPAGTAASLAQTAEPLRSVKNDLDALVAYPRLFQCPACEAAFVAAEVAHVTCSAEHRFPVDQGLPILFSPHPEYRAGGDVTDVIREFYMENPFPDYEDTDSVDSLIDRAEQSVFAAALNKQLPPGARVLEVGCGTGQLSLYLSVAQRDVYGVDLCPNSLRLARAFRDKHGLNRARFYQMNLFRPIFRPATFDLVYCSGVLHHTGFPRKGFESICRLVKPGRYVIVGLYNRYMRIPTHLRRSLSRVVDIKRIDPIVRRFSTQKKQQTWFMDQYRNPHETDHSISEVMNWFEENGVDFVNSIPSVKLGQTSEAAKEPFANSGRASALETILSQVLATLSFGGEGGLFLVVGKRR